MKYLQICKIGQICLKSVEILPIKDLKFAKKSQLFWLRQQTYEQRPKYRGLIGKEPIYM